MLKIVSLDMGVGGGHFFLGFNLWQTWKRLYPGEFLFSMIQCTGIDAPINDPSLEIFNFSLESEKMYSRPEQTMLYQYLMQLDPDILFLETIWFPVSPFLKKLRARKIAYSFYMPPQWFLPHPWDQERLYPFRPEDYDFVFSIDPGFEFPGSMQLPPAVNTHFSLLHPPEEIRKVLKVPRDKKLALLAHNGEPGELEDLLRQAEIDEDEYCFKSLSSFHEESSLLFPLAHYMTGVDLAIGGCGYSFFYETKSLKIPSLYIPQPRVGNEQHWRFENNLDYDGPYDGTERMVEMVLEGFSI